jgi:hypothetical protein
MDIDVSGLYMIISSYSSDVKEIAPQNKTQNSVLVYEIGTINRLHIEGTG